MLSALIAQFGHETVDLGAQQDRAGTIRAALDRGAEDADAILTTGGASAGDEDHISRLLRNEGTVTTWRIAVKPGRPLALGLWNGVPVFGLPGNPVAAFVCALMFARPALAVMAGQAWPEPLGVTVPAAFSKAKKPGRREYLRARLTPDGRAEVFHSEGSGLIGGLSWSDGLVELPDGALDVKPGTPVRYLPYAALR
ncbi:MAG: molybdopterin-binding protein [Paracoccaceae bacterium]